MAEEADKEGIIFYICPNSRTSRKQARLANQKQDNNWALQLRSATLHPPQGFSYCKSYTQSQIWLLWRADPTTQNKVQRGLCETFHWCGTYSLTHSAQKKIPIHNQTKTGNGSLCWKHGDFSVHATWHSEECVAHFLEINIQKQLIGTKINFSVLKTVSHINPNYTNIQKSIYDTTNCNVLQCSRIPKYSISSINSSRITLLVAAAAWSQTQQNCGLIWVRKAVSVLIHYFSIQPPYQHLTTLHD